MRTWIRPKVHEVVVEEQALAPGRLDVRGVVPADGVGPARLQGREHADEAALDTVALSDLAGEVFFADPPSEVLEGTALTLGHAAGVFLEPRRLAQQEALQLRPADAAAVKEGREGGPAEERKIAAEQDAVEAGQSPLDLVSVLGEEVFHARMKLHP